MKPLLLLLCAIGSAGTPLLASETFTIWPDGAPGALGGEAKDKPTLTVMMPTKVGDGLIPAVLMTPGGGYKHHSSAGPMAQFFRDHGFVVFYLKYRLPTAGYRHPAPWNDAQRAMRIIRSETANRKLDPKRIGVIGFSSGGHVATTLITHTFDGDTDSVDPIERHSCRPDFAVLFCPVVSMTDHPHRPSVVRLLGPDPTPQLLRELSNELHVTKNTPPTYLAHAEDDGLVPVENSKLLHAALREKKIATHLDLHTAGNHGFFGSPGSAAKWQPPLKKWLVEMRVFKRTQNAK
ncbi:MAG: endo-1,4-beta-xylanase [Planctomycetaceae bacterium]|nr:endo-1,4-beta-xylanase [Planctomycetaceae bacterium]